MKTKITTKTAKEILRLLSFGLSKGKGKPIPGEMCIEAVITVALGEPFSDKPSCVEQGLGSVNEAKIALNDCDWSSPQARAKGMQKIALAQLGSNTLPIDAFCELMKLKSTQRILPYIIQKHYEHCKDEKLLVFKAKFESLVALDNRLWKEFYNYYNYYYNYYNYYYHCYHCYYYCYYNYNYYNYNYYNYYVGDEFMLLIANTILQCLIELKSPGCKFLKLIK
jgi:hypothetical protein